MNLAQAKAILALRSTTAAAIMLIIALIGQPPVLRDSNGEEAIIVDGDRTILMEEKTMQLHGNLIVKDKATLVLRRSWIEIIPEFHFEFRIFVQDKATLILEKSTIIQRSRYARFVVSDSARLVSQDSQIINDPGSFELSESARALLGGSNLRTTVLSVSADEFVIDNSQVEATYGAFPFVNPSRKSIISATNIEIQNSEVNLRTLSEISLEARLHIRIVNSKLASLNIVRSGNEPAYLLNVDYKTLWLAVGAVVRFHYWLTALVLDKSGGPVTSSNVTVHDFLGGALVGWSLTDSAGTVRFPLLARIIDHSSDVFVGNYKIRAVKGSDFTHWMPLTLDTNRISVLRFERTVGEHRVVIKANVVGLSVTIDDRTGLTDSGGVFEQMFEGVQGTHQVHVFATHNITKGKRAVFIRWTDGETSPTRLVTAMGQQLLEAVYKIQYLVEVYSRYGNVTGSGWYDEGSRARIVIAPTRIEQDFWSDAVFSGWQGDFVSTEPDVMLQVATPLVISADWRSDYSRSFGVLLLIVLPVAATGLAILRIRTRSQREDAESDTVFQRRAWLLP